MLIFFDKLDALKSIKSNFKIIWNIIQKYTCLKYNKINNLFAKKNKFRLIIVD